MIPYQPKVGVHLFYSNNTGNLRAPDFNLDPVSPTAALPASSPRELSQSAVRRRRPPHFNAKRTLAHCNNTLDKMPIYLYK